MSAFSIGPITRLGPQEGQIFDEIFGVPDDELITHYLSSEYFQKLIATKALRLRRLDLQGKDLADGSFPAANSTGSAESDKSILKGFGLQGEAASSFLKSQANDEVRMRTYVHSWRRSAEESREMWELHGNGGRGICIKSTVRRITESLPAVMGGLGKFIGYDGLPLFIEVRGVSYTRDDIPFPAIPGGLSSSRKQLGRGFEHEREVRIMASLKLEDASRVYYQHDKQPPDHQIAPIDLGHLVESVVIGPNIDAATGQAIASTVNAAVGHEVAKYSTLPPW